MDLKDLEKEMDLEMNHTSYQFSFFTTTFLQRLTIAFSSSEKPELFLLGKECCRQLCVLNSNKLVRKSCGSALTENFASILSLKSYRNIILDSNGIYAAIRDFREDHVYREKARMFLKSISSQEWKNQSGDSIKLCLRFLLKNIDEEFELYSSLVHNAILSKPQIFKELCIEMKNKFPICNFL